ncbi:hypothetical protein C0Q70_17698 [Pomacea canaliculata]|uniref:PDZ domain-containing protein n=2 Tax=Pomacea canaliculata TaxID=400727 RepID=A0A2T7NL56_POMCA|nr:hypothetical protein C0Q70_17698 [Pomacea canaliculata]
MTAEKEWRRELVTATSETTKDITAPDKGLTAQSGKKDRQETSQILLADAAVVKKEEEDDLTPISAKRASVSVISYNFVEPVKRPDAGASVDESSATGESLLPRSREAGSSPSSAGIFSGSSGPNDAPVVAARSPYETALAQVHREGEDSQLTVVTPLAEPLQVSTSTPSSDEVTVTESESEASLSPLASAVGDFKESAIYVFPRNVLSKPDYEFIFSDRPQLARFGRAQSAPGKPPCTIMESRTLSAPSRSMSLHAASSATLKMPSSRIYDVPPRRLPLKFPVESNRPGSVLFHDLARATATDRPISFSFSSVCKQQQPQHLHQSIPDNENPYVNDADDVSQPTVGRSSVWDESQKNAETRRSRLQRTYNTCSLAEGQKTDSQSSSRELSRHPFDVEAVVTKDHRVMEGMVEEAVYANSVAVYFPQKATQNSRTTLSTASQKDIFNETSANVSGNSDHRAQTRGQTAKKGITQESSRESDQRKKEKGKRESKKPCLGREASKEPSVEDGWVNRGEEAGHGERMMRKPVRAGQMLDQDTSEAATVMDVASPDVRNRRVERRDSKDGWSEQDETLKLNPEPSLPVEVTVRSKTSTHTHQYHSVSGKDTDYEDVHVGGQWTTNNPVAPAPIVHARLADAESSPVPETSYVTKQTKYNEYSNIIRIDSNRLKAAHAKSLSTAALFTATNRSSTLSAGRSPLRNAISLEDGLISVERKKKKKKTRRKPDKDGSPRKYRRHFSFQKLLNMFRKKKKKKRTEKIPEAQEETTEVAEVRTSNKFFNMRKILKMMKKPKAEQTVVVSSSQDINCIRPIGRLLQLNADGTQLVELIRPQDENLGIVLTTGSDEENGIFVSGFTDNSLEKHLAGVLSVGDQIIKVNERFIRATSLDCIHNMIMGQQRIKLLTFPMQGK